MSKRRRAQRLARIVNGARVELVAAISGIMVAGDPTPFVFEGAMRAGIRSGLVLTGEWTWARADETAREITREALEKIGAKRPTWAQGQPRYTEGGAIHQDRDTCARCRKPIPMERILGSFAPVLYCDKICTQAAAEAR